MSTLQDLAAVRVAIELCHNPELKQGILCEVFMLYEDEWNEIVEKKSKIMVDKLDLTEQLKEKTTELVALIGLKMLVWAEYHERILGISRDNSINYLNSSLFTPLGTIDYKKAAEELMKDKSLDTKQKYTLACLHCLTELIPDLHKKMSKEEFYDEKSSSWLEQPQIVKFWSYYLVGQIDRFRGDKTLDEYMLESAAKSGSKSAVEYCLEKTSLSRKKDAVMDAALEVMRTEMRREVNDDQVVFEKHRCPHEHLESLLNAPWIPTDYFLDVLYFLFSKMRKDEKIELLKKDIECPINEEDEYEDPETSGVLEHLLHWPYQNYFMDTAALMWEFLPERNYGVLLLKISAKMNPRSWDSKYGQEKCFDYRKLLREFWCQSPDHYKRYVFSDKEILSWDDEKEILNEGKDLLAKLFRLRNFLCEDWKNIELFLDSATDKEKEGIISSEAGKGICIELMTEEKLGILDGFISNCLPSKEQAEEFKRGFSFSAEAQRKCVNFIRNQRWDAAESFIRWSSLNQEEVKRLKREMICSVDGRETYVDLLSYEGVEIANKFCEWCFCSEEEIGKYKTELKHWIQ